MSSEEPDDVSERATARQRTERIYLRWFQVSMLTFMATCIANVAGHTHVGPVSMFAVVAIVYWVGFLVWVYSLQTRRAHAKSVLLHAAIGIIWVAIIVVIGGDVLTTNS